MCYHWNRRIPPENRNKGEEKVLFDQIVPGLIEPKELNFTLQQWWLIRRQRSLRRSFHIWRNNITNSCQLYFTVAWLRCFSGCKDWMKRTHADSGKETENSNYAGLQSSQPGFPRIYQAPHSRKSTLTNQKFSESCNCGPTSRTMSKSMINFLMKLLLSLPIFRRAPEVS